MRRTAPVIVLILMAGCSQGPGGPTGDAVGSEDSAPGIAVTAAPGVAFRYHYGFRLPAARIAATQEAHAAACERLGVARCRITAMRYTRDPENRIDAMLGFVLAPELARTFGRDGIRAIEAADGMVLSAQITGEDAGARIGQLADARDAATAERRAIDARTADTTREARAELERQRANLADTARQAEAGIAEQRAALAATPVTFDYESGAAIRGFDAASPFTRAADLAVASARWTIGTALAVAGVALPPLVLALIGWWAWTRGRRAWSARMARAT